ARRTDDQTRAANRYQTLVLDYPTTRRAADALRALNDLDLADPISYIQAGLVRFHQAEYERAIGAFDTQLALGGSDDELAGASYYRALSLMRRGRESAARVDFEDLAVTFPASPLAPTALFRANRLRESADATRAA